MSYSGDVGEPGIGGGYSQPAQKGAMGMSVKLDYQKKWYIHILGETGFPGPLGPPGAPGKMNENIFFIGWCLWAICSGRDGYPGLRGEKGLSGIPGNAGRQGELWFKNIVLIIVSLFSQVFLDWKERKAMLERRVVLVYLVHLVKVVCATHSILKLIWDDCFYYDSRWSYIAWSSWWRRSWRAFGSTRSSVRRFDQLLS